VTSLGAGVAVRYPAVITELASVTLARLSILCEVENHGSQDVHGTLEAVVPGVGSVSQAVSQACCVSQLKECRFLKFLSYFLVCFLYHQLIISISIYLGNTKTNEFMDRNKVKR
jgi:hypothetical protein